jgi:hypothetical protein
MPFALTERVGIDHSDGESLSASRDLKRLFPSSNSSKVDVHSAYRLWCHSYCGIPLVHPCDLLFNRFPNEEHSR